MKSNKNFSLIELIAVIAVLSVLMLATFQFFSTMQNVWQIAQSTRTSTEDARIALDLISRDLENSYYGDGSAPFWHWGQNADGNQIRPSAWGEYRNEFIAFVSSTPNPPNAVCVSKLCEVKYQLYYAAGRTTANDKEFEGWLRRSVTGDRLTNPVRIDNKWNFFNNIKVSYGDANSAFTANSNSSGDYQKLIPFVTDLKFDCYDAKGNIILADSSSDSTIRQPPAISFPYSVTVSLTLLDHSSWQKWIGMTGTDADSFRENKAQTFTRTIHIGDRGQ